LIEIENANKCVILQLWNIFIEGKQPVQ